MLLIHDDITAAGYAALTHTTGNNGCMARHTTTNGQDTLGGLHTCDILWRGLETHKDHLLTTCVPCLCILCRKDYLTTGCTRRCTEALAHRRCRLERGLIKLRMKKRIEVSWIDHRNGFLLASHALIHEVTGDLQCSLCGSLTISGLQHVQLSVLYGKLHVLHVSVMLLEGFADLLELCKCLWELLLHLLDVHRGTNTGYNVLALCIGQELTEQSLRAGGRITCEGNTRTTVIAHVTEGHRLYVYCCAPGIWNIVVAAVNIGTRVIPGTENRLDSAIELLLRIGWEISTEGFLILRLKLLGKVMKILCIELHIELYALLFLLLINQLLELALGNLHHDVRIHLNESSIRIPGPAWIA